MDNRGGAGLALEGLVRRFGGRAVVDGVSLAAPTGRVTALVGPSGCGKTTLLRLIAGIERPDAGRVLADGEVLADGRVFVPPERRRVGLMFQDYALFPHLTLRDNVLFGLGARPRGERGAIADQALERVGLARFADRRPSQLSGGEQQRLALARALAPSPRVLLMDEPFSNLDRGLREEVRAGTLALLREAGVTTLIVTHDPEEALAIGDHLVLLQEGRVIQAGPAAELYARPTSLAAARALSEVGLVRGEVREGALQTPLGPVPMAGARDGDRAIAVFRPEHLARAADGEGVPGRIEARSFRGASTLLTVRLAGAPEALRLTVATEAAPQGADISVVATGRGIALPYVGVGDEGEHEYDRIIYP